MQQPTDDIVRTPRGWMPRIPGSLAVAALLALLAGCAPGPGSGVASAGAGGASRGAFLAYEHDVRIELEAQAIPARLAAARQACEQGSHGPCEVLQVEQAGGDHPSALLTVRIVPDGVEPLIALAGEDARIGSRNTQAEDLAAAVHDTARLQARLQREQARLQEFQQRRDLSVADMIALSQQLAQVEAQLEEAAQVSAQQQRRIDTQKLTLRFRVPERVGGGEIGQAVRDFIGTLAIGTAWTIRAVAFVLPLAGLVVAALWLRRRLRRRQRA
ncbi:DUF4349 domain-containing protein [Xanthomonas sp. XNM01]|uniref:DUF4349 domain-containing protein n=1 Tax=Xanthomonas sp. XNM01 TaxID=2769289 RepID=UPI0017875CA7|nr:DUF4349 domain-containing protein [Xanthomonas sp. XNM01]MBD9368974.1 DUF4349 domain-containing protein [Xanthomonas sp. XNM01]